MNDSVGVKEKNVVLHTVNEEALKKPSKLKKISYGKGKILLKIDGILTAGAAILEIIREIPGFEYLKTMTTGNLVTKFNVWIAKITAEVPDLTGLSAEQIYALGQQAQAEATISSANSWGLLFSAILEFIIEHPTVAVIGISTITCVLSIPFKLLINKLRQIKFEKELQKIK